VPHLDALRHGGIAEQPHPGGEGLLVVVAVQEVGGAPPQHLVPAEAENIQHGVVHRDDDPGVVLAHAADGLTHGR
jgi:hypothetical protein